MASFSVFLPETPLLSATLELRTGRKSFVYLISVCRLQEVLKDYDEVVSGIPENVLPLMKPFTNRVDETIKPGLTMLNWTSLNVYSCEYLIKNSCVCGCCLV